MIGDSVAPTSEAAAGATPVDVRSMQVTSDAESQRSIRGADAQKGEEDEVAKVVHGLAG